MQDRHISQRWSGGGNQDNEAYFRFINVIPENHNVDFRKWIALFLLVFLAISTCSCSEDASVNPTAKQANSSIMATKISSRLQQQVSLRREQLANPTSERLAQMQAQGMNVSNLSVQRIYIYLNQKLNPSQANELQNLNINVYPDSWVSPVGNHPTGFLLADMPVGQLEALAAKEYVVRLDTAEVQSQPQSDAPQRSIP
jgi:hypothetical protein